MGLNDDSPGGPAQTTALPSSSPPGSRPARLVVVLQHLEFGGTQRQTLELVRRLDPSRFRVEIWLLMAKDNLAPLAQEWGIPLVWLSRQSWMGPWFLPGLWRRLKKTPMDLLLLMTGVPNIWGRILGRLAGVPLIVGNIRDGNDPRLQHDRWLWPLADHILCNAESLKTLVTTHYGIPGERLTVIRNGVDTDFFRPPSAGPTGPLRVLAVARLVPKKDLETLIKAFSLVAPAHPEAELWLVGEGPREHALRRLASRSLPPGRVQFLPPRLDLCPLLHQASLLVLSSLVEGLPNVLLEAMAAGLPVVATQVEGVPEVVVPGQTGWLVPPRDVPALAAAISQALADPEMRRAFGRAGRERVKRDFSFAAMVSRFEEVLHHLLVHNPRHQDGERP